MLSNFLLEAAIKIGAFLIFTIVACVSVNWARHPWRRKKAKKRRKGNADQ